MLDTLENGVILKVDCWGKKWNFDTSKASAGEGRCGVSSGAGEERVGGAGEERCGGE